MFDSDWRRNGHIDKVVRDAAAWVEGKKVAAAVAQVRAAAGAPPAGDGPPTRSPAMAGDAR